MTNYGTVKFFNDNKGYGFISRENGNDIFFHVTKVTDKEWLPCEGDPVEFETEKRDGKINAIDVTKFEQ